MTAACTLTIDCQGLNHRYGKRHALQEVSLTVEPGTILALLGRNGAGKSTLVRALLGLQRPQQGSLRVFGLDPWRDRLRLLSRIGSVPEEPDAPPSQTVAQLEVFCGRLYPTWHSDEVLARLDRGRIPLKSPFGRLSRGQKAQVSLALALGHHPELLVLDDPTLGLDAVARQTFYVELVGELADRNTTVLMTSHDLAGVEGLASHVAILHEGRLMLHEPMEDLKSRFRLLRRPGGSLEPEALERLSPLQTLSRPWGSEALVSRFDPQHMKTLEQQLGDSLEIECPSLESLFIALAGPEVSA